MLLFFFFLLLSQWKCKICWAGKTYRFRISNVGLTTSINFRIQGHKMLLVEAEGTHTLQNTYSSLDIHLGQSYSVLVTADQPPQDYYIVVSTRFTSQVLSATSIFHYSNSATSVSGLPPGGPTTEIDWSLNQARSIRYFFVVWMPCLKYWAPGVFCKTFYCNKGPAHPQAGPAKSHNSIQVLFLIIDSVEINGSLRTHTNSYSIYMTLGKI